MEIFSRVEELDPELKQYLRITDSFEVIQHPLVYSVPHTNSLNAYVNMQLVQKKASIKESLKNGQYESYVFLHEKPYRVEALKTLKDKIDQKTWAHLCRSVWIESENLWASSDFWFYELQELKKSEHFMNEKNKSDLNKKFEGKERVKVYRGCTDINKRGYSWTFDQSKAEWFSTRFSNEPVVLVLMVARENVVAYFNQRNEKEVILDPAFVKRARFVMRTTS